MDPWTQAAFIILGGKALQAIPTLASWALSAWAGKKIADIIVPPAAPAVVSVPSPVVSVPTAPTVGGWPTLRVSDPYPPGALDTWVGGYLRGMLRDGRMVLDVPPPPLKPCGDVSIYL